MKKSPVRFTKYLIEDQFKFYMVSFVRICRHMPMCACVELVVDVRCLSLSFFPLFLAQGH